jgi:hypothetical protein
LPDGVVFHTKNANFIYFGRPWDEKVWCVSWQFGIDIAIMVYFMAVFVDILVHFFPLWMVIRRKIW